MMVRAVIATLLLTLGITPIAAAKDPLLHEANLYIGGGLSNNDANRTDSAIGLQFFVGYDLPVTIPHSVLSLELGYWDSGDMEHRVTGRDVDADGLYLNGVIAVHLSETIDFLGRAGFDFGDDDGLMLGVGIGVNLSRPLQLRFEYVARDETDSVQANLVFHF